ncbi:hypothetical protein PRN20_04995 [Devosia sp. ZB163]|uniref:hypothetical protein n=1 Tax=Devosia sp. ZB163 TaxID=3025938 RepID=UPI0023618B60|nr:hypothetical protein [Devosia sp. ZB163]MDC9823081.1 hypothetical protein [Devosia sp. ZB163]
MNQQVGAKPALTDMEEYLFDLNGYLVLKGALTPQQVAACNATYDEIEDAAKSIKGRGWWGNVAVDNSGQQEAIECRLEKGDALLFVDAIAHGSARRTNPGNRRIAVYRYGPSWGHFRLHYRPSPELLDRLPPRRRGLVYPHGEVVLPPGRAA